QVCLYMHDLEPHLAVLNRIFWYVQRTLEFGLKLYALSKSSLVAYSDAKWAGFPAMCRSTSGYRILGSDINIRTKTKHKPTKPSTGLERA
ncbi:ribonuclease H-like domain-containing protein, partial [Tanacetum coccineum]